MGAHDQPLAERGGTDHHRGRMDQGRELAAALLQALHQLALARRVADGHDEPVAVPRLVIRKGTEMRDVVGVG